MAGSLRGRLTVEEATALILADSVALRAAATRDLTARVASAPDWSTADLVWHIAHVHWMWRTVVTVPITDEQMLSDHPDIERPADDDLLAFAAEQAEAMVGTFRNTDPASPCWTWAPGQQDCGFVIRHQVQEAAVHRWDAEGAVGTAQPIDSAAAADAVEEFLTVSLASPAWPAEGAAPLGVPLVLRAHDTGDSWTVTDGAPGTLQMATTASDAAGAVTVSGSASDLLLWLYERVSLDADGPDAAAVVGRFRGLTSTD